MLRSSAARRPIPWDGILCSQTKLTGSEGITLHRKPYLQPFEQNLAEWEIKGLGLKTYPATPTTDLGVVGAPKGEETTRRISRLAYFDWVETAQGRFATLEARRESCLASGTHRLPRRRVLRFGPHALHEYRGKFFPQLVRSLCNAAGVPEGSLVLDPMCGSGTTLSEARALDVRTIGIDRNPLSVLISDVKTCAIGWTPARVGAAHRALKAVLKSYRTVPVLSWEPEDEAYLRRWFHEDALAEVRGLLSGISAVPSKEIRRFLSVCASHILRSVSYQKLDDLRVRKEVKTYERGQATHRFLEHAQTCLESIDLTVHTDPHHCAKYEVKLGDAREIASLFPDLEGIVDLVVTSPPYATALPYLDTDRLSLIGLKLLPRGLHRSTEDEMIGSREVSEAQRKAQWDRYMRGRHLLPKSVCSTIDHLGSLYHREEVGFRRRNLPALLGRYFLDMRAMLRGIHAVLRPGASAYLVVGNNSTRRNGESIEICTDVLIMDLADRLGFSIRHPLRMELLTSRDIFKENRGTREQILHFVR